MCHKQEFWSGFAIAKGGAGGSDPSKLWDARPFANRRRLTGGTLLIRVRQKQDDPTRIVATHG